MGDRGRGKESQETEQYMIKNKVIGSYVAPNHIVFRDIDVGLLYLYIY